jgi:hypothetical protein
MPRKKSWPIVMDLLRAFPTCRCPRGCANPFEGNLAVPDQMAGKEAHMGRSDIYVKIHQLSDAELIKLLQFQGDDDGEADSVSVMVEEEIARRKAGGGTLQ